MSTRWEGNNSLLVRMSGVLQLCCERRRPSWPATTLQAPPPLPLPSSSSLSPPLPYTYHHHPNWLPVVQEGPRYTILPTISVVSPWDDDNEQHDPLISSSNAISDQSFGDSNHLVQFITPTPVLPPPQSTVQPSWVGEAAQNATHRFYDILRAVLHGDGPATAPALREGVLSEVQSGPAGVSPQVQDSPQDDYNPATSPLIQVCAVLAVLVLVIVLLFHSHHFRRDCMTERRVLRRVVRRYHVTRTTREDVERNESDDVPDVTL